MKMDDPLSFPPSLMDAFASLDTTATHWRAPWRWVHRGMGSLLGSGTVTPVLHSRQQRWMLCTCWRKLLQDTLSFPSEMKALLNHMLVSCISPYTSVEKCLTELILVMWSEILSSFKSEKERLGGGWLPLTSLGVKSNVAFLSALAVRTGWVGCLCSSSGAQDNPPPPHGF